MEITNMLLTGALPAQDEKILFGRKFDIIALL
jgi:hypothetical protein